VFSTVVKELIGRRPLRFMKLGGSVDRLWCLWVVGHTCNLQLFARICDRTGARVHSYSIEGHIRDNRRDCLIRD
jgi:hypothetical protein